jgi:hypothetical protein
MFMTNPTSKAGTPAAATLAPASAPRRNVDAMASSALPRGPDKVRRKEIHDKWPLISDVEANAMQGRPELVVMLQARYGMSAEQAQHDVDAWAKHMVF